MTRLLAWRAYDGGRSRLMEVIDMSRQATLTALVSVVAMTFSVACADRSAEPGETPPSSAAPSIVDTANTEIDATNPKLYDAEILLVERCLGKQGFTVHQTRRDLALGTGRPGPPFRLSPAPDIARSDGYGVFPRTPTPDYPFFRQPQTYRDRYFKALGRFDFVDTGGGVKVIVPQDGCWADVYRSLYGDLQIRARLTRTALSTPRGQAWQATLKDERYKSAVGDWAACMRDAGYPDIASPQEPFRVVANKYTALPRAEFQQKEIALAVADATCAEKHRTNDAVTTVYSDQLGRELRKHETDVVALRDLVTKGYAEAQRQLG